MKFSIHLNRRVFVMVVAQLFLILNIRIILFHKIPNLTGDQFGNIQANSLSEMSIRYMTHIWTDECEKTEGANK